MCVCGFGVVESWMWWWREIGWGAERRREGIEKRRL